MNEQPKSIWKKSWTGLYWLYAWGIVMAWTFFCLQIIFLLIPGGRPQSWEGWWTEFLFTLAGSVVTATFFVGLLAFFHGFFAFAHWLFCWRNLKRFLFACACLVTLIALIYAEEDWRGKHDWETFKREWQAKGEKFDYASLIPPPVPDNQNFAMAPIWVETMKAALGPVNSVQWFGNPYATNGRTNFVNRLGMPLVNGNSDWPANGIGSWAKGTVTDLKGWQNYYRTPGDTTFPVAPQPQTPAQDVLLALSKYDSTIEELRRAGERPYSRFPIYSVPDHPFDTFLPHLGVLKGCSQVLQLRANAELRNGESDMALDDVKLMLRLADAIHTEPCPISHLVRIVIVQITLQSVYEGLAQHKWSDAQLAQLDSELAKLDFLADFELSMRGERACGIASLDYIRRTRNLGLLSDSPYSHLSEAQRILSHLLEPDAVLYQNELTIARMQQRFILPMVNLGDRTVSPSKAQQSQTEINQDFQHYWSWPYKFIARMLLMPGIQNAENAVIKFAYAQESVDLARVAIALERYRLAHGEYPESLDVLAPQFIANLPHDIINGQPLHYRRTADGQFVLYSVGWNETDDGGVVGLTKAGNVDNRKGDWVWRYPAK